MRSVFCIVPSRGHTDRIIVNLRDGGFANTEISILFLEGTTAAKRVETEHTPAPSEGPIRGVVAWIANIHRVVIDGAAPLIVGGPIAEVIIARTGGGIAGGLISFGIPQAESERYSSRIQTGHIFISIQTGNPEQCDRAREIFAAEGAEDICTKMNVSTPKLFSREIRNLPRAAVP